MRFATFATFATSLAIVSAQTPDLSKVPDCAISCLVAAIPASGCGVTDITCQCTTGQASIQSSLEGCVPKSCSADQLTEVAAALAGVCSAAGVSVAVPSSLATAPASAASGASSAAASMTSAAGSAVSSAASAASSAASAASSAASSARGSASSRAASATSSAPAESTGGAVANAAGLGAVALGLAAALL